MKYRVELVKDDNLPYTVDVVAGSSGEAEVLAKNMIAKNVYWCEEGDNFDSRLSRLIVVSVTVIGGTLSKDFKEGYCDGHGQAIENVRHYIIGYLEENREISIDKVNEICDMCSKVDYEYLNQ